MLEEDIKRLARSVLKEITYADLVTVTVRVFTTVKKISNVPDIMTDIRILTGVAICRQSDSVKKSLQGRDVVDLDVKYYPGPADPNDYLEALGKEIKKIKGVDFVKVLKLDDQDISVFSDKQFIY